jgi:hypothetical protein
MVPDLGISDGPSDRHGVIIANSVAVRIQHLSSYRPANLPAAFVAGTTGLKTENVV